VNIGWVVRNIIASNKVYWFLECTSFEKTKGDLFSKKDKGKLVSLPVMIPVSLP
jgi:hypothetical protein